MPAAASKEVQIQMLYTMKLAREIETRIERKLYRQGKILGGVYVGRGQEAISVGACIQLQKEDSICPSHRDMGAFLIKGFSPRAIFAQYMGRSTGPTRGKDGNLHMGDLRKNTIAFVSMLGDTIPVAVGVGLSYKMRHQKQVVLCFFGEGTSSRGDFHEGLNMAAVLKVPVVYICNNNQYAYSTPMEKQMAIPEVSLRAQSYGMPGVTVDGNEVLTVYETVGAAIDRARQGEGPSLIECKTFRMTGHSAHDDMKYVPKELLEEWEAKDPIHRFEAQLLQNRVLTEPEIQEMDERIILETDGAVALAEQDPYPAPEETLQGVYASPLG
jgi:TPP-dependent pyruvate/acetoin dehydrogenase alpha subunit